MSIIISGQGKLRLGLSILVVNHSEKIRSHIIKSLYEAGYFDADIWEAGNDSQPDWVHVSFRMSGNRKKVLRYYPGQGYEDI